ncbi:MAG: sugar phosphate isomerase/epimerase [Euryarchaeota archaeon]|nr:sugar phosphate isomerase/epimerase [Euryarchaeota archaeon]
MVRRLPHVSFVETVLWGQDLLDLDRLVSVFGDTPEVVVHQPFSRPDGGDVDVVHPDEAVRSASFTVWESTLRLADRLGADKVVIHPGGLAPREIVGTEEHGLRRADALERFEAALERLGRDHDLSRVLVENMPTEGHDAAGDPVAFLIGSAPVDLMGWRDLVGGFCLDISHAAMTPGGMQTVDQMFGRLGGAIRHLHVADGRPPDHEGLAIGDGIVDWRRVAERVESLDEALGDSLTAVAEIKGGHLDDAAGFRVALERMHRSFMAG